MLVIRCSTAADKYACWGPVPLLWLPAGRNSVTPVVSNRRRLRGCSPKPLLLQGREQATCGNKLPPALPLTKCVWMLLSTASWQVCRTDRPCLVARLRSSCPTASLTLTSSSSSSRMHSHTSRSSNPGIVTESTSTCTHSQHVPTVCQGRGALMHTHQHSTHMLDRRRAGAGVCWRAASRTRAAMSPPILCSHVELVSSSFTPFASWLSCWGSPVSRKGRRRGVPGHCCCLHTGRA